MLRLSLPWVRFWGDALGYQRREQEGRGYPSSTAPYGMNNTPHPGQTDPSHFGSRSPSFNRAKLLQMLNSLTNFSPFH